MEQFRIRTRVGDVELEVAGATHDWVVAQVDRLIPQLLAAQPSTPPAPPSRASQPSRDADEQRRRPMSLKELCTATRPEKKNEIAVVIAYFLEHYAVPQQPSWTPGGVAAYFGELKKDALSNPSMTISSSSFFMKTREGNAYTLSETGVRWVEERLASKA